MARSPSIETRRLDAFAKDYFSFGHERRDKEGKFEIGPLPPGTYEVRAAAGRGLVGRLSQMVEVGEKKCGISYLRATANGRINGLVRHRDGSEISEGITVRLIPLDYETRVGSYRRETSLSLWAWQGKFIEEDLPARRYLLAMNPEEEDSRGYSRSYCPRVPDRESAHIIEIRRGQELDLGDFLVDPPAMRTR